MRNFIKMGILLSLFSLFLSFVFTCCGSNQSKDEKVTLTMGLWDSRQEEFIRKMVTTYTEQNPNIEIKLQNTPFTEYWTKLETSISGGQAPDIFWINVLHIDEYQEAGILKDLTQYIEESSLGIHENFLKPLVDTYTIDGRIYALPKDFDTRGLFFNKSIFDKAGVPYPTNNWTFEDMVKAAEDLKSSGLGEGVWPLASNRATPTYYYPTIIANGGYILNKDKTSTGWNDPKTIGGIKPWVDLIDKGLSPTEQQMADTNPGAMFESGNLAMHMAGSYMVTQFLNNEVLGPNLGLVERPSFNGMKSDIMNGVAYAVSEQTKHSKEAIDFVIWLGSHEAMKIQGESGLVIPARLDAQEYFINSNNALDLKVFFNNLDQIYVMPHTKVTSELNDIERKYLIEAWARNITVEEACKKIKIEQDDILDKMNGK